MNNKGFAPIIAIIIAVVIIAGGIGGYLYIKNKNNPIACTLEAKQCPDGSYVGRTGPNCEFTSCPNISTSTAATTTSTSAPSSTLSNEAGYISKSVLSSTSTIEITDNQLKEKSSSEVSIKFIPAPAIATSSTAAPIESSPNVTEKKIVLEANVNLLCYVHSSDPYLSFERIGSGSGVIVSPDGYILTARHVVDGPYAAKAYAKTLTKEEIDLYSRYKLDYCEVGIPVIEASRLNDVQLNYMKPPYQYIAHLVFVPSSLKNISENESNWLDFALLKIDEYNPEFGGHPSALPESFPYNQFLNGLPSIGENILTYTYPMFYKDIWNNSISLRKGVGKILRYYTGDKQYTNENILFDATADSQIPGSSGGPVFWKGYIAGIDIAGEVNVSFRAVSAPTIVKILKDAGYSF